MGASRGGRGAAHDPDRCPGAAGSCISGILQAFEEGAVTGISTIQEQGTLSNVLAEAGTGAPMSARWRPAHDSWSRQGAGSVVAPDRRQSQAAADHAQS